VPTREAVVGERATRNALWLGIRRHFLPTPGEPVPADPPPPAERYEHAVSRADDAADDLFADAERATRYAEFRVRESQMQNALGLERERAASVAREQAGSRAALGGLARGARPALPEDRRSGAWVARREAFLQKFDASQAKRQEARQHRRLAQEIRSRLGEIYGLMKPARPGGDRAALRNPGAGSWHRQTARRAADAATTEGDPAGEGRRLR
jgi:hypothetical protein